MRPMVRITLVTVSIALAGCSSPAERAYKGCKAQFDAAAEKARANPPGDPTAKAMADAMLTMNSQLGEATCGAIRDNCKADPNGALCRAAVAEFSK
jgi:hypothetical protein